MIGDHCNLYEAYINGGNQFSGLHERIEEWIERHPGTHFNKTRFVSVINGRHYYHIVIFLSEEDLLAFKLTFLGYVD